MPGFAPIPIVGAFTLTGRRRHRLGWRNRMILQVEERAPQGCTRYGTAEWSENPILRWRDASPQDLLPIEE